MTDPLSTAAGIATLAQTGTQAIKAASDKSFWRRTKNFWRNRLGSYKIAVYGYSGSGKSSFLHALKYKGAPYLGGSTRHIEAVTLKLPHGRRVTFYDCPGQELSDTYRRQVKTKIIKGKIDAIINVVCYGYNETESSELNTFDNEGNIREDYLGEMRKRELEQLDEWHQDINSKCNLKWMLTLVNKADIWWHKNQEVMKYYRGKESDYGKRIHELKRLFPLHATHYCSRFSRFGGRDMPMRIDDTDKGKIQDQLLQHIEYLIENER